MVDTRTLAALIPPAAFPTLRTSVVQLFKTRPNPILATMSKATSSLSLPGRWHPNRWHHEPCRRLLALRLNQQHMQHESSPRGIPLDLPFCKRLLLGVNYLGSDRAEARLWQSGRL